MAGEHVKCPICNEYFNANKEPSIHLKTRYYHKNCYENQYTKIQNNLDKVCAKNIRKCAYCGQNFDITQGYKMVNTKRYAHIECYNKNYNPDEEFITEIYSYLKSIGFSYNYLECERQRNHFISKLGYTNEGIYNSLRYFYGVKKGSPEKSGNRIGIVSYIYNEAKEYYSNLEKKQNKMKKIVEKQLKEPEKIIKVKYVKPEPKKKFIDLTQIGVGLDE